MEHAVPFGTVTGKLLLLGKYLVFVDDQQLDASFVVPKSIIESLSADNTAITIQTNEDIRNRSGDVRRLSFRALPGSDLAPLTSWYGSGQAAAAPVAGVAPAAAAVASTGVALAAGTTTYEAIHNHTFGACKGRLLVSADQISYESIDSVSHSRRWEFKAIKELKQSNPYSLEISPFSGGGYNFKLSGTGMDPDAFRRLVDRVTTARSAK
ncbi:MAG: hypothetical protein IH602_21080 [Bryobacteraceae bacterium]|nr:hypothetical protein [Bryobacteraceae bacterium]